MGHLFFTNDVQVGGTPAAPLSIFVVANPSGLALGDASGGTVVRITVSSSVGLIGAKVCGVALTSFSIVNGTTVQGTTAAMTASSTKGPVVVTNGAGDSPPLTSAFEAFWPSNIASTFMWMRADLGYTAANTNTWIDQIHGKVFDTNNGYFVGAGTFPTLTTGMNGKAALSFTGAKCIGAATPLGANGTQEILVAQSDAAGASNCFRDFQGTTGSDPFFTLTGTIYDGFNSNTRPVTPTSYWDQQCVAGFILRSVFTSGATLLEEVIGNTSIFGGPASVVQATTGTPTYGRSRSALTTAGKISEHIVASTAYTVGEQARIDAYLFDRYSWYPGLISWQHVADLSNGAVASWPDHANGAHTYTQATGAKQPTKSSSPNVVTFVASGPNYLQNSDTVIPDTTEPFSWSIKFKLNSLPGASSFTVLEDMGVGGSGDDFQVAFMNLGGYQNISFKANAGSAVGISVTLDTLVHTLVVTYNGGSAGSPGSYTCYLDGVAQTVVASAAFGAVGGNTIGARAGGANPFDGQIGDRRLWLRVLASYEAAAEDAFLRAQ